MLEVAAVYENTGALPTNIDFGVDPLLLAAVVQGTHIGLMMTRARLLPVGTSRLTTARHAVTAMVGLVGVHSGNVALNMSEHAALYLASGLLSTTFTDINEDCVDAIMEIGNMVAGGIKNSLASTPYAMQHISLPSLVLGQRYTMAYSRGIRTVSVEFELSDMPFSQMNGRYISCTLSLLGSVGA
jgi:CheY-specific phosphatase CheX